MLKIKYLLFLFLLFAPGQKVAKTPSLYFVLAKLTTLR